MLLLKYGGMRTGWLTEPQINVTAATDIDTMPTVSMI